MAFIITSPRLLGVSFLFQPCPSTASAPFLHFSHPQKEAFCYSSIHRALAAMETHLAGGSKTCLVGGKVTLADIVAVINLFWPLTQVRARFCWGCRTDCH